MQSSAPLLLALVASSPESSFLALSWALAALASATPRGCRWLEARSWLAGPLVRERSDLVSVCAAHALVLGSSLSILVSVSVLLELQ